jgi:stage II sporulation protein AA (anti-sigma F factor antagonist)
LDRKRDMDVKTTLEGPVLSVRLKGSFDAGTAPAFETELTPLLSDGLTVAVDMSGVDYISSAGVAAVLRVWRKLDARKGCLKLQKAQPGVAKVFQLVGLENFLDGGVAP